jgi:hypothetical protein
MSDRVIVYDGALPQTTDILYSNKFAMIGQAFLNAAVLGSSTVVAGLICAPTAPATLQVTIGQGSIYQMDPVDASAYGDLGTDTNTVMKQGINYTPKTLTITPPSTAGYSQVFLVQAELQDVDSGSMVLAYYNSSNPDAPYSGPANSGTSQFTRRNASCTIALKAGVAAPTGSQTVPTADVGYIGLYTITVVNGQTAINSGNIVQLNGGYAPFINTTLPYVPNVSQSGVWNYKADTGTANALAVTFAPAPTAYTGGLVVRTRVAATNTGPSVINVNGLGNKSILRWDGTALLQGDLTANGDVEMFYDDVAGNFRIMSPTAASQLVGKNQIVFAQGTHTFVVPAGVTAVYVRLWAAGGGGGGANSNNFGEGAAGGGYTEGVFTVTPSASISCITGVGGAAGNYIGGDGGNGGSSSFGSFCSATGGAGGGGNRSGLSATVAGGGAGTGGAFSFTGANGGTPLGTFNSQQVACGGGTFCSAGGIGAQAQLGQIGSGPGAGGAGGCAAGSTAQGGGAGNDGLIIISW